jgi:hypothetical protein
MEKKIKDSNILIAKFMGMKSHDQDSSVLLKMTKQGNEVVLLRELQYHSSWSWLMPVVEKINSILYRTDLFKFTMTIDPNTCSVYDNEFDIEVVDLSNAGTFIELVYLAVVESIILFNENK